MGVDVVAMRKSFPSTTCRWRHLLLMSLMALFFTACQTTPRETKAYRVVVKSGDSLASIAAKYGTTWNNIAWDNGIKDYRAIKVGQVLKVRPGPGGYAAGEMLRADRYASAATVSRADRVSGKKRSFFGFTSGSSDAKAIDHPNATDEELEKGELRREQEEAAKEEDPEDINPPKSRRGLFFGDGDEDLKESLIWPVRGEISSGYGPRWGRWHRGIDIRAGMGTPIKSAAAGTVIFAGRKGLYGLTVIIRHERLLTLYGHCSRLRARVGDKVKVGQPVAEVGKTGNARGVHLHFEVRTREDNQPVDPMPLLRNQDLVSYLFDGPIDALTL